MHPPGSSPFIPDELLEKRVFDVNGRPIGHVRAVEPAEGAAHAIDVALRPRIAESMGKDDIWLSAAAIVSAEDEILLNDDAGYILHPELLAEDFLSTGESR